MHIKLSGQYADMAHGVGEHGQKRLDIFARLAPTGDAAAGEVVPEIVYDAAAC